MNTFPTIYTQRLLLRRFELQDAPNVQRLAGASEIAEGTFMPHPYTDGLAEQWIASLHTAYETGSQVNFAIVLLAENILIGSIGLTLDQAHCHAHLGYWIGVPYWNHGFCTEAARRVLRYGFDELKLHRICALCFKHNPASGRVLQNIGMTYEGCQREHYLSMGRFVDVEIYSMLHHENTPASLHTATGQQRVARADQPYLPNWESDMLV